MLVTGSKAEPWNPCKRGRASAQDLDAEPPDLRYQASAKVTSKIRQKALSEPYWGINPHSAPSTVTIGFYLFSSSNKAINYTFVPKING